VAHFSLFLISWGGAMNDCSLILALAISLISTNTLSSQDQSRQIESEKKGKEGGVKTETSSITSDQFPTGGRSLNEQEQKRLRVSWDKPKRKVNETGPASRPVLEISGKLSLLQEDQKTLKPIDWPLPIRVVVCPRPNEKPDWNRWHDRRNSIHSDILVGYELVFGSEGLPKLPAGVFSAPFELSNFPSPVGATKPFQVALCLGEKNGNKLTWCNTAHILPQTVKVLEITGPKPLSRSLQLINACPTPIGWEFDPIPLVRAANHLRSLGKDKSIGALREFLELAYDTGYSRDRIDPENIDTSNQWCLASLLPLTFDGIDHKETIRVWKGIPFHTVVIHGTSGWPASTRELVDRAAQKGKLIQKPLRPADDPLEAADSLFNKIVEGKDPNDKDNGDELRKHLRRQAWRVVHHLVDPDAEEIPELTQATWDKLKTKAARLHIHWDEERQEYVAGQKSK
jgi:hypothetical protein